jgi:head-tail adaptor
MKAGELDRRVTILVRNDVKDAVYGTKLALWFPHATVGANVREILPPRGDHAAGEMSMARRQLRIRMRWRDDVSQANRIMIGNGNQMRIVAGPAMIGRRDGLEIMVEELSTEGQQP